ncbi:MAG: hypothetical protein KBT29_06505 [Prevotellaceae bacterium]|nr:hypothetical protein [Candidatus Minthosoma caballi]
MKVKVFMFLMLAMMALASCSSDSEVVDKTTPETKALRQKYGTQVVGDWYVEKVTDTKRYFQQMTFQENGTVTYSYRQESRQEVLVDGVYVMTDWMVNVATNGYGTWSLNNSRENYTDYLDITSEEVENGQKKKVSTRLEFAYANNEFLFVQPMLGNGVECFKRVKKVK